MKCPKCSEEIQEQISITGLIFKKKTVNYFCPICNWENKREFSLSKQDVIAEENKRINDLEVKRIEALNTKKELKDSKYGEERTTKRDVKWEEN